MRTFAHGLLALVFAGGVAFAASGCGNDAKKCEQVADKMHELAKAEFGDIVDDEDLDAEREEGIEACKAALEANPDETSAALDCFLAADSMEDVAKCELPAVE